MFCNNCGAQNDPGASFCTECGSSLNVIPTTPENNHTVNNSQPAQPANGLAIAGMVCGIVSCLCIVPIVTGVLGIIFGCVAKSKGNKSGMATAGIVCGSIGLALFVLAFIGILSDINSLTDSYYYY